jgi:molybdate transport system regulatory protein
MSLPDPDSPQRRDGCADDIDSRPGGPRLSLRIFFGRAARLGPGKAELLERIRDTGSIAAAGRAMGMSYKRAWSLVEEMNADFAAPLVARVRGGAGGGGAQLTPEGEEVVARYRRLEAAALAAAGEDLAALEAMLREAP